MNILLIDTSSSCVEFGYSCDGRIINEFRCCEKNSADTIAYEIDKFFKETGRSPKDTNVVSLSNGPGSFTGLRIGSAFAKGFCFATGCKLIQVSSLDILANRSDIEGREFISLISSNSGAGEFYYAVYKKTEDLCKRVSDYSIALMNEIASLKIPIVSETILPEELTVEVERAQLRKTALHSHLQLANAIIGNEFFTDINIAEPFYMKEFTIKK